MNGIKTQKWLKERNIILEECFTSVLRKYAEAYKKENNILRIDEVYRLLNTSSKMDRKSGGTKGVWVIKNIKLSQV